MDYYCDEGIPYSFDIELPDLGELGMLLSPSEILEVSQILKIDIKKKCRKARLGNTILIVFNKKEI